MRLLLVIAISISVVFSMSHTTSGLVELPQDGKHKQIAFNGYAFQLLYPKQNGSCTWRCSAQCGLLLNTTVDCDGAVQFESFGNKTDVHDFNKACHSIIGPKELAPPNDAQPAPSAFDMDDDVASDALKEILTGKIGLKIETAEIIVHDNEFTCLVDIIDCKESDFEQMGFPKGGRKRIMRKLMTFAKANGVGSNGGNKDGNKAGNGDNVLEQLVQILTKQNDKKNVNPVEGDKNVVVQKQQKLWSKQGNRKCYLGKITKLEIYAYNGLCLRIIMLSLETQDASMIRKTLFEKTRCGAMDRVRCSFENNEWKHSNMTAVRQTIVLLDDMKVVQIVSEEQYGDKYTDWQCTFRRNQISGFMYAQKTLDDAKTVWKWMRKTREYGLCWATYANATKDSTAARLGLISSQPPDWAKFMAWKQSKPEIYKPMPSKQ
eukprot:426779_1